MTAKPKRTLHYFIAIGAAIALGLTLGTFMNKGPETETEKLKMEMSRDIDPTERRVVMTDYQLPPSTNARLLQATNKLYAQLQSATSVAAVRPAPHKVPDFALTDSNGAPFTQAQLKGRWHLVFTGFTHCPDICPPTLNVMEQVDSVLKTAGATQPRLVFVSVDPTRDTPAVLKRYLTDRNILGVTGSETALKPFVQRGLFMPYAADVTPNENYSVSHNGSMALLNPKGEFVAFFPQHPENPNSLKVDLIARDLQRIIPQ